MDLGAGQVDGGGYQAQTLDSLDLEPDLGDFGPTDQHIVQGGGEVVGIQPQRKGEAGLGVEIDHQDALPLLGQGDPEGLHGGRLGHTTLLVGHCHHFDHGVESMTPFDGLRSRATGDWHAPCDSPPRSRRCRCPSDNAEPCAPGFEV